MKFSLAVFRRGKPIYWVIGAVALFVLFYFMVSRQAPSAASSGGTTVIQSGPTEAQQAMQIQYSMASMQSNAGIQAAQIGANADIAMATLAAQVQLANTQASADVAKYTAALDAQSQSEYTAAQQTMLATQVAGAITTSQIQAQYGVETANIAAMSVLDQANVQAAMFSKQLDTNAKMFTAQMASANFQSLAAQVGNVKKNDRDNMLAMLIASNSGQALNFSDPGHSNIVMQAQQPLLAG